MLVPHTVEAVTLHVKHVVVEMITNVQAVIMEDIIYPVDVIPVAQPLTIIIIPIEPVIDVMEHVHHVMELTAHNVILVILDITLMDVLVLEHAQVDNMVTLEQENVSNVTVIAQPVLDLDMEDVDHVLKVDF